MLDIVLILKGFLIGIAKVIPGVSGSLFAVSMGLYDKAIEAISNFFKNFKENIFFLGNLGIGLLIAIILGSNIISYFLVHYPFLTTIVFIGFLLGTFPNLMKDVQVNKIGDIFFILIIAVVIISMSFFRTETEFVYTDNLINNLYVILLGFIDAATMIIPGISGTAIFILMGSYHFILDLFGSLTSNLGTFVIFMIGIMIGVIIVSKIMNWALKLHRKRTYLCIFGFAFSSIFILGIDLFQMNISVLDIIIGLVLFYTGYKVSYLLNN